MRSMFNRLTVILGLMLAVLPAAAQQIVLNSGSVIGGGPSYDGGTFNSGFAPATRAVDEQTGAINIETEARNNYWLGPDGVTTSYFVLDLGAAFKLGQIDLFNTHNWESLDRSTNAFQIAASNNVSFVNATLGFNVVSGVSILSGTLPFTTAAAPPANTFTSSNGLTSGDVAYRYISFTFSSYVGVDNSAGQGGGLHEIRITAIPEPGTTAFLAGFAALSFVILRVKRKGLRSPVLEHD